MKYEANHERVKTKTKEAMKIDEDTAKITVAGNILTMQRAILERGGMAYAIKHLICCDLTFNELWMMSLEQLRVLQDDYVVKYNKQGGEE